MNTKNIIIGEHYRLKGDTYCWAKVLEIIPPKKGVNKTSKFIAKCEWARDKNSNFGMIKYFAISDLTLN